MMPIDYEMICAENKKFYGTGVNQWAPKLLADRYDDRTHFLFELLQNAEDAMSKREVWEGPRVVHFSLSPTNLIATHYGKTFSEEDVRGICGIGVSTKEEEFTSIGKFGIGFKSVYAFTKSPEIHSGDEHFAIDDYVFPRAIPAVDLQPDSTEIHIPFSNNYSDAAVQILRGLQNLNSQALLFLHEIEEISWSYAEKRPSELYRRESIQLSDLSCLVTVSCHDSAGNELKKERWIVFSRAVFNQGREIGNVEIAFALDSSSDEILVRPTIESHLVVFFPTVRSTNLGFLVQGPYRTTPSRDNVPDRVSWNRHLIMETSKLLVDALREFCGMDLLDIAVFRTLPLDSSRFPEDSWLAPLFGAVREALMYDPLLPCYKGGYAAAQGIRLARTQDLRNLIDSEQLTELFGSDIELRWLSEKFTADLTPEIVNYLKEELNVHEVTPENLITMLNLEFLERQPDEWIENLYEFLNGRSRYFLNRLRNVPIIRLEDGSHTTYDKNQSKVYLPSANSTDYLTVRRSVCQSEDALAFLESLGLSYPDPVDDVITNILPKYNQPSEITEDEYQSDVERVLAAYNTDSASRRQKLQSALKKARFVRAVDTFNYDRQFAYPDGVYQSTSRLKGLFNGVPGVLIVDDAIECLYGENICGLLETIGVARYLVPIEVESTLTDADRVKLRIDKCGTGKCSTESEQDWMLRGLKAILNKLKDLQGDEAKVRCHFLWRALCDVQENEPDVFVGEYSWRRFQLHTAKFDAAFVKLLNESAWVPDGEGVLQKPEMVLFDSTGWEENPFLLTKIRFKSSDIDRLAREVGVELGVIELLSKFELTSKKLESLLRQVGIIEDEPEPDGKEKGKKPPPGKRRFVTYIAVDASEVKVDPDGLSSQDRMKLEDKAVELILYREAQLERMISNNPGFDLQELDSDSQIVRLVEVKAMTGTLSDRPVTLTKTQFKYAQKYRGKYWLYIVENADKPDQARIVRINDPYGKAKTFTFDRGWADVAETEIDSEIV